MRKNITFSELSKLPKSVKIVSFVIFIYYIGWGIANPFFPLYLREILGNYTQVGIVIGVLHLFCFLWSVPMGAMADKVSKKKMIIFTLFLYLPMGPVILVLRDFTHFILFRIYHSFNTSSIWLNAEALIRQRSPVKKTSESMGLFEMSWILSVVIGSAVSGYIFMKIGYSVFIFISFFSAFALLFSFLIKDKKGQTIISSTKDIIVKDKVFKKEILDFSKNKEMIKFSLVSFFVYFCINILWMVLPLFSQELGANPIQTGFLFSLFFLPRLSEGHFSVLADKFGKKSMMARGLFFCSLFFFVMFFVEDIIFLFIISFLLSLFGFSMAIPPLLGRMTEVMPKKEVGEMTGILKSVTNLGMGISPIVAGIIADSIGLRFVFLMGGIVCFLMILFTLRLKFK